jgi:hypothetical protein
VSPSGASCDALRVRIQDRRAPPPKRTHMSGQGARLAHDLASSRQGDPAVIDPTSQQRRATTRVTQRQVVDLHRAASRDGITARDREDQGERARSRLVETWGRRCGLAGMAVSQVVALRGPGTLALEPRAGPVPGLGFRTACWPAGASPWRGSKKARVPARVLGLGMPAAVLPGSKEEGPFMAAVMIVATRGRTW